MWACKGYVLHFTVGESGATGSSMDEDLAEGLGHDDVDFTSETGRMADADGNENDLATDHAAQTGGDNQSLWSSVDSGSDAQSGVDERARWSMDTDEVTGTDDAPNGRDMEGDSFTVHGSAVFMKPEATGNEGVLEDENSEKMSDSALGSENVRNDKETEEEITGAGTEEGSDVFEGDFEEGNGLGGLESERVEMEDGAFGVDDAGTMNDVGEENEDWQHERDIDMEDSASNERMVKGVSFLDPVGEASYGWGNRQSDSDDHVKDIEDAASEFLVI